MQHAMFGQFERGQRRALVARARLVHPDVERNACVMRQIERRKRGPIVDRREPARVAMGQDIERTAGPAGRHRAQYAKAMLAYGAVQLDILVADRSEEHTSELQSLMRNPYDV